MPKPVAGQCRSVLLAVAMLGFGAVAQPARAQICTTECGPPDADVPSLYERHATALAINAGMGMVAVAVHRLLAGEKVWPAAVMGLLGGGFSYGGKYVATQRFPAAGLLGRQVASLGNSLVRSAGSGRALLAIPIGPVRGYIERQNSGFVANVRIDVATVIAASFVMASESARLDLEASLSAGSLVLRSREQPNHAGSHFAGMVLLPVFGEGFEKTNDLLIGHEMVHVLQQDQAFNLVGADMEEWVRRNSIPISDGTNWLDINLTALLFPAAGLLWDYRKRPWEREAYLLAEHLEWY